MKITYLAAAFLSTAIGASAAHAEKSNTYVFLDANYNNISTDVKDDSTLGTTAADWGIDVATTPVFSEDKVSDTGTGFRIGGGLMFAQNWGVEASYAMYGTATDTIKDATYGDLELATRARSFTVDVARYFSLTDKFRLYGKLGVDVWTTEIRAHQSGKDADRDRDAGYAPMLGIGGQVDLTDQWLLRAEASYRLYDATYRQNALKDNPSAAAGELNTLGKYTDVNTDVEVTSFSLGVSRRF